MFLSANRWAPPIGSGAGFRRNMRQCAVRGADLFAAEVLQVPVFNAHARYRAFIVAKTTPSALAAAAAVRALNARGWFRYRRIISTGALCRGGNSSRCDRGESRGKD